MLKPNVARGVGVEIGMIIGLVGPFGSGCTRIAHDILKTEMGYTYISLSDILREEYYAKNGQTESAPIPRNNLQDFGDALRAEKGSHYLSDAVIRKIGKTKGKNFVIDSIRNPEEVYRLKREYVDFFVLGIFANNDIRWNRVKEVYDNNQGQFLKDEKRDKGEKIAYGQRVTDAFLTSDAIILNEEQMVNKNAAYTTLESKVKKYINLFAGTESHKTPSEIESIMAMAYANSLRSSCLKRKVGAVIVDSAGNVFSSGYNEVPSMICPAKLIFFVFRQHKMSENNKKSGIEATPEDINVIFPSVLPPFFTSIS